MVYNGTLLRVAAEIPLGAFDFSAHPNLRPPARPGPIAQHFGLASGMILFIIEVCVLGTPKGSSPRPGTYPSGNS